MSPRPPRLTTESKRWMCRRSPLTARWSALVLSALLLGSPVLARAAASTDPLEHAVIAFRAASSGSDDALTASAKQWDTLRATHPNDPRVLAYAGAATARLATTTLLPWKKMRFADDGLALLDRALQLLPAAAAAPSTPAQLETRFVAAATFLALPSLFNRQERGRKLLEVVLSDPLLPDTSLGLRQAIGQQVKQCKAQAEASGRHEEAQQWRARANRVAALATPSTPSTAERPAAGTAP